MGESLLALTIITLIVITIRRARPVILENPVIIQRPGQYHITLAPQLNRAQTFVEKIASQYIQSHPHERDLPTQYFEVRDPKVFSKGNSCYLLAITVRDGVLYFQAVNPKPKQDDEGSHYKTLHEFSESVLKNHPLSGPVDEQKPEKLYSAVDEIAAQLMITVKPIHNHG
jgi:hypothetical protein